MKRCVILCAGGCDGLLEPLQEGTLLIAADGGLAHAERLGLTPDVILGDFDSLGYAPTGARVFPVEKDDTDSMLAVRHGLAAGCREFYLYGALDGPRLDHTVANLQTLQFLCGQDARGVLVGNRHIVMAVKNARVTFPKTAEGILSVFALGADARGVTLQGLQYPLQNGTLTAAFPLGVSNHFVGEAAEAAVAEGTLTLLFDREVGLPEVAPW